MAALADKDSFTFGPFKGLRNVVSENELDATDLSVALNVDLTRAGRVRRRTGYALVASQSSAHSLWSNGSVALFVSGTSLYELLPDYSTRVVRTGLTSGKRMWYTSVGARVFYSNTVETGVFESGMSRSWGLAVPELQPQVEAIGGSLPAGRYQYAVTYVRADGQESGAQRAGVIELAAEGGLKFTDIPVSPDPGVTAKRLYISPTDGDVLYYLMTLPAGETGPETYMESVPGVRALGTQFLSPAPAGSHLSYFAGRTLVARGPHLYYSEPYSPELFNLNRYVTFPEPLTLVAPVDDGVYCGTGSEIVWLPGKNPDEWGYEPRTNYGAISGALAYTPAEDITDGAQGMAAVFATRYGFCAGMNGGTLLNLTGDRHNYPMMDEGAAVIRDNRGATQYVATLRGREQAANTAF